MATENIPVHEIPAANALRRGLSRWRLIAFVALAIAIVAIGGRFALERNKGDEAHIARVEITGVIATDRSRLAALEALADDENVKAVIIAINSPGGTAAGGEELYEALSVVRAQKPVVAVIRELGASAAYMTAIGADHIFARRLSIVGSIGVLIQHVNASKLFNTIGIEFDKVQTGPLKAEPDIDDPLTGAARVSLQALVDDSYHWFVDVVAERREIERDSVLSLSDGRIITGRMALDLRLIDAIGGEHEAIIWLEESKDVATELPVLTHYPWPQSSIELFLDRIGGKAINNVLANLGIGTRAGLSSTNALDGLVSLWQAGGSER